MRSARRVACTNSSRTRAMSALVISRGTCQSGAYGRGEGAIVCQAPSSGLSALPPTAGAAVEPLRPACPSCRPCAATPYFLQKSMTRFIAASFSSEYIPAHFREMRPSALTCVDSVITSAPAPRENWPRCIRCQSLAVPLSELYWHIGETTMRFFRARLRRVIGAKRAIAMLRVSVEVLDRDAESGFRKKTGAAGAAPCPPLDHSSAVQVLWDLCRGEDVVARILELAAQVVQVDVEELSFPLAHLARHDHGLDIGAVHQRHDGARHVVERRHVDSGRVEDDDVGLLARGERARLLVQPQVLRAVDGGEAQHVARRQRGRDAGGRCWPTKEKARGWYRGLRKLPISGIGQVLIPIGTVEDHLVHDHALHVHAHAHLGEEVRRHRH